MFPLVVVATFLTLFPLGANYYRSNSLGQKLEELDSTLIENQKYYLYQEDNVEMLFEDGILIKENLIEVSSNTTKEIQINYLDGEVVDQITTYWEDNLPKRIENGSTITYHTYVDEFLIEKKEVQQGNLIKVTTFYRGVDGTLNGIRVVGSNDQQVDLLYSDQFFGESKEGVFNKLTFFDNNLVAQQMWIGDVPQIISDVSYDEDGNLVIKEWEDDSLKTKTYDLKGLLVSLAIEDDNGELSTKSYYYDDSGTLEKTNEVIISEGKKEIDSYYEEGQLVNEIEWEEDLPVKSKRILKDGNLIVTLFDKGKPYADVTYASDGKRVLSLEYRMDHW